MDKIKAIGKAIYESKAVRTALKGLGIAMLVVVAEVSGFGEGIVELLKGL